MSTRLSIARQQRRSFMFERAKFSRRWKTGDKPERVLISKVCRRDCLKDITASSENYVIYIHGKNNMENDLVCTKSRWNRCARSYRIISVGYSLCRVWCVATSMFSRWCTFRGRAKLLGNMRPRTNAINILIAGQFQLTFTSRLSLGEVDYRHGEGHYSRMHLR